VLVDNLETNFVANPSNGIPIPSFSDDPNDRNLNSVWEILCRLEHEPDVRPVLKDIFGLEARFTKSWL
jgi:hypothetical protein